MYKKSPSKFGTQFESCSEFQLRSQLNISTSNLAPRARSGRLGEFVHVRKFLASRGAVSAIWHKGEKVTSLLPLARSRPYYSGRLHMTHGWLLKCRERGV